MPLSVMTLRRFAFAAGCLCIPVIVWLSLIPKEWELRTGAAGQIEHVIAYAGTGALLAIGLARPAGWRLFTMLAALACVMEVGQIWVPGRTSQVIDAVASVSGAGLGVLAGSALHRLIGRRLA
ncbi:VanZ family protein [Methylobacterium sp. ID0610]|uniref:VanZ family protein n=1 Tax=Methylobacterium carpenticola TaxID=3344827 RepID=UPI00369FE588